MRRRGRKSVKGRQETPAVAEAEGGSWFPVDVMAVDNIAASSFRILSEIGVSDAPPIVRETVQAAGGRTKEGRLLYPPDLIDATIKEGPREVLLAGQTPNYDLLVGGKRVYTGTGGAAPNLKDPVTGEFRASTLRDLHRAARLADRLDHIHFFSRSLVAGDIEDALEFDLATAAASLLGTSKHVMVQATDPAHVAPIAQLCFEIAGSEAAFAARPFLSLNVNHAVPPLRFHHVSAEVMVEAVRFGIPVHCNVFGQLGASSPVTIAGSVAQTLAETLAGLAFIHALDPKAPRIAGPRPMITDLRTGGMAGGAGEQATATALAVQVLRKLGLPCSSIAGATDSKCADFQAGYEKALTINTAIQAGAHLITQAAGTQAGLMVTSFEAMVADNDMLGAILRANTVPDVTDDTLMLDAIAAVVRGEGHYLGRPETYVRMRSDFRYPEVADRASLDQWRLSDRADMAERAAKRAQEILDEHWPEHLPEPVRTRLCNDYGFENRSGAQS